MPLEIGNFDRSNLYVHAIALIRNALGGNTLYHSDGSAGELIGGSLMVPDGPEMEGFEITQIRRNNDGDVITFNEAEPPSSLLYWTTGLGRRLTVHMQTEGDARVSQPIAGSVEVAGDGYAQISIEGNGAFTSFLGSGLTANELFLIAFTEPLSEVVRIKTDQLVMSLSAYISGLYGHNNRMDEVLARLHALERPDMFKDDRFAPAPEGLTQRRVQAMRRYHQMLDFIVTTTDTDALVTADMNADDLWANPGADYFRPDDLPVGSGNAGRHWA